MKTRHCPIWDAEKSSRLPTYCRDQWSVEQCDGCGHAYLKNPPGYDALVEDFAWEKTYETEHERRLAVSPIAYRLDVATRVRHTAFRKSNAAKYAAWFGSGKLLDIGCAAAGEEYPDFTRYGIEISKTLAEEADRAMQLQGGYCIHGAGAEAIWKFPEDSFDGIIMFSYLEHEEEPLKVLKGAVKALKRTGKIYVRVPNFGSLNRKITKSKWVGLRDPDHVNYVTVDDLKRIAARAGLEVSLLNPLRLPFDDNINALLSRAS